MPYKMNEFTFYLLKVLKLRLLLVTLIKREINVRYRQSILGILWAIVRPISLTAVLYFSFFSIGNDISSEGYNPFLFILSGLLIFELFVLVINNCTKSIIANRQLVEKICLPKLIFPLATGLASILDFLIAFFLFVFLSVITNNYIPIDFLNVLVISLTILATLSIGFSIGLFLSAVCVWYRDIKFLVTYISQLFLFLSPIGYSFDKIPENFQWLLDYNPLNILIELCRSGMLARVDTIDTAVIGCKVAALYSTFFLISAYAFMKLEKKFADVI